MANIIAKIGAYGDPHLSSKSYGAHNDYPKESLEYFGKLTELTEELKLTHLIGSGDFSFGRFHTLEYRSEVEKNLERMYKTVNGNHYELFGNHDVAGYGKTERDFYIDKGLIKPSCNFSVGNVNITMVDYKKNDETEPNIIDNPNMVNCIFAHDFYKFNDTKVANFGDAIILDNLEKWFGADILICGHVHKIMEFQGAIANGNMVHELKVSYPGCMNRPAYREGHMDTIGRLVVLTVYDDESVDFDNVDFPLWDLEKSFNLAKITVKQDKKDAKISRIDISDVVKQLDTHDRNVGSPEDIINGMQGIDERYKNKAVELLKNALA